MLIAPLMIAPWWALARVGWGRGSADAPRGDHTPPSPEFCFGGKLWGRMLSNENHKLWLKGILETKFQCMHVFPCQTVTWNHKYNIKVRQKKLPLGYWVLHTHNKGLFQLANTIFHGGVGDQAEDVISHNNLSQYTDEQWRRQSRSTKTAVCSGIDNQCQPCSDDFGLDRQERMGWGKES